MTTKIAAVVLLMAAFGYALWLHVFRKPLPDAGGRKGWRRGFFWATVLFVAWMGTQTAHSCEAAALLPCYGPAPAGTVAEIGLPATVRAAWLSLDKERGEELRQALETEVAAKGLCTSVAELLRIAFRETAQHYYWTRGAGVGIECYDMTDEGAAIMDTREHLLTRMAFLAEAGRKGQIDKEVYDKVAAEIARSLAVLGVADAVKLFDYSDRSPEAAEKRIQATEAILEKTVPVDAVATEAADALAKMAAEAPEGWAESPPEHRWGEKKEKGSDLTKPGVWQPPPSLSREHGGW